jgi:hypothetical protein
MFIHPLFFLVLFEGGAVVSAFVNVHVHVVLALVEYKTAGARRNVAS